MPGFAKLAGSARRRFVLVPVLLAVASAAMAQNVTGLTLHPATVLGGGASIGEVVISKAAPTGGFSVALSSSSDSATVPASVTVAAGKKSAEFKVTTTPVSAAATSSIGATGGSGSASVNLTIEPPALESLAISPKTVIGGATATGAVLLNGDAPTGGVTVTLSSDSTFAKVTSATVPAGKREGTFEVTTTPVPSGQTATITATLGSTATKTATLAVEAPGLTALKIVPAVVKGGSKAVGTVELNGAAPAGGETITLASDSTFAPVSGSVAVEAGARLGTFAVATSAIGKDSVAHISASLGTVTKTAELSVLSPRPLSITLSPAILYGGAGFTGVVKLDGPAPAGGASVALTSNSSKATVPASVTVDAGATTASFAGTTEPVGAESYARIVATLGAVSKGEQITILAARFAVFTLNPTSVVGGATSTGTVTLSSAAPAQGATVALSSSSASATVPTSVTIQSGQTTATFAVTTTAVTKTLNAVITATFGPITRKATLHIQK